MNCGATKKQLIQPSSQDTDGDSYNVTYQSRHSSPFFATRPRMVATLALVTLIITIPFSAQAGFFSKLFSANSVEAVFAEQSASVSAVDIPLLAPLQNPNPMGARGGAELVVEDDVLVSTGPVGRDEISESDYKTGEIRVYTVKPNETLSEIAEMFGVTANTIMWANDIAKASAVQPGDTLVILPIIGVRHVVKRGDTISAIAEKYDGDVDEILSYNQLASADGLSVGDTLIIPGGAIHAAPVRMAAAAPVRVSGSVSTAGYFSHPAPGTIKTQGLHGYNAVDLAVPGGGRVPILAAASGEVIVSKSSGWNGGYGQYIVIKHPNGTQSLYAHLSQNYVGVGDWVTVGTQIGMMGSTGKSTGTHLHFEIRGGQNPI